MGQSCSIRGRNECINNFLGRNMKGREEGVAQWGRRGLVSGAVVSSGRVGGKMNILNDKM
jgi:hypothetical protein